MPLASPLSRFSTRGSLYSLDSARNRLLKIDVIATAISMTVPGLDSAFVRLTPAKEAAVVEAA